MTFDKSKIFYDSGRFPDTRLSVVLHIKYRWVRVLDILGTIKSLELAGGVKAVTLMRFKRILAELIGRELRTKRVGLGEAENLRFHAIAEDVAKFLNSKTLSWEKIEEYGQELASGRNGGFDYFISLGQLMMLCRVINVVLGWKPEPWTPSFCSVCWRFVMSNRKYCSKHAQVDYSGLLQWDRSDAVSERGPDNYWSARRLAPSFLQSLRSIALVDKRELRRSGWRDAISRGDVANWLKSHRPMVYGFLEPKIRSASPEDVMYLLIAELDFVEGESAIENRRRADFHEQLVGNRRDVFDMVQRAEAWFSAQAERRSNWGGVRRGG